MALINCEYKNFEFLFLNLIKLLKLKFSLEQAI
jgi:hypothetical protein